MKMLEFKYLLTECGRKGSKKSKRRQIDRIWQLMDYCRTNGIKEPDQIGRRQIYEWYEEFEMAKSTARDRYYAVKLFWELLGKLGDPPRPTILKDADLDKVWEEHKNANV